ncbi:D-galactonate dehydratase family protein [bacterium]|nr:D-galactonate dehydratase family protein [bacterium]
MKITEVKLILCSPSRNFLTLKIITDQGVYGLGDATLNGREKAVATYLEEYCIPCLIGKDPFQIEDIWHYFYVGAYWRRGPVKMTAISAIDMALWDIKGKALNIPVYNLIGGKSRQKILVYAHAEGKDIEETVDRVGAKIDQGFLAIRAQSGIPGLEDTYGVSRNNAPYEPAVRGNPKESIWDTDKYLNHIPRLFKRLREVYGDDIHLLHDAHHRCTPVEAARLARELESCHLFWLEDAVRGELQEGYRLIRSHSTTPLAIGEVFNTIYDLTTFITEQLIDYIRMPIVHGGGLTHLLKVAAMASVYHIRTGFHGATDLSPVNLAASLHFDLAVNNFGIQEYMPHQPLVHEVFKINYEYRDGHLHIDDTPGLGVDIDEEVAKKHPYQRAYLPMNRKMDGTVFHW